MIVLYLSFICLLFVLYDGRLKRAKACAFCVQSNLLLTTMASPTPEEEDVEALAVLREMEVARHARPALPSLAPSEAAAAEAWGVWNQELRESLALPIQPALLCLP